MTISLVMLAFYGDGSGEHGKGPMVVAGYLGHAAYLIELETKWCEELRAVPSLKYFKGSQCVPECGKLTGEFAGWTPQEAEAKRSRLAQIVNDHSGGIVALSSMVTWEDYRRVIGDGIVRSVFYHPYFFCFHGIASLAIEYSYKSFARFNTRVAFVLDTESNGNMDVDCEQQYRLSRNHLPEEVTNRMGSTTWDTDIKFPMLQVADMLAWSVRAKEAGFDSPVLHLLRDHNRLAGDGSKNVRPSGIEEFVRQKESAQINSQGLLPNR